MIELDDLIRYGWTFGAAIAMPYALWNLRELLVDNYAVAQDRRQIVTAAEHEQAVSDCWIHGLLAAVILCNLLAGVCAIFTFPIGALSFLFTGLVIKIFMVYSHAQRRRLIYTLRRTPASNAAIDEQGESPEEA